MSACSHFVPKIITEIFHEIACGDFASFSRTISSASNPTRIGCQFMKMSLPIFAFSKKNNQGSSITPCTKKYSNLSHVQRCSHYQPWFFVQPHTGIHPSSAQPWEPRERSEHWRKICNLNTRAEGGEGLERSGTLSGANAQRADGLDGAQGWGQASGEGDMSVGVRGERGERSERGERGEREKVGPLERKRC